MAFGSVTAYTDRTSEWVPRKAELMMYRRIHGAVVFYCHRIRRATNSASAVEVNADIISAT